MALRNRVARLIKIRSAEPDAAFWRYVVKGRLLVLERFRRAVPADYRDRVNAALAGPNGVLTVEKYLAERNPVGDCGCHWSAQRWVALTAVYGWFPPVLPTPLLDALVGHPLAGAITFEFADAGGRVRFVVDEVSRSASTFDRIGMAVAGESLQGATWRQLCERMVHESGGSCPGGVAEHGEELGDDEAAAFTAWVRGLVEERKREENAPGPRRPPRTRVSGRGSRGERSGSGRGSGV